MDTWYLFPYMTTVGHRNKQDYDIPASEVLYNHEAARNPSSRVTAAMGC